MDSWSESSTGDNRAMRSSNYSDLPTSSPSGRITGYPEIWLDWVGPDKRSCRHRLGLVADTLWTTENFQTSNAEDGNEVAPYHHRWACNDRRERRDLL